MLSKGAKNLNDSFANVCLLGNIDVMELFISKGVDVNLFDSMSGKSPLIFFLEKNSKLGVIRLLCNGAKADTSHISNFERSKRGMKLSGALSILNDFRNNKLWNPKR